MMYQQNTVEKQSTNEFFGICTTQELEFMPLALQFLYSSCPICQMFSCPDDQMFEIVALGSGSANGGKNV